jgi:hypothetical protein
LAFAKLFSSYGILDDGQDIWMNEDEVARRWAIKLGGKSPEVSTTTAAKRGRPKKSQ